jgi:hypothetical protein
VGDQALRAGAGGGESPLQAEAEVEVGELGLPVGLPGPVAALQVGVARIYFAAHVVRSARDRDDARSGGGEQGGQEMGSYRPVTEVVDTELHLEAVDGSFLGDPDRLQRAKVQLDDLQGGAAVGGVDVRDRISGLALVACGNDDVSARAGERSRGLEAEAPVRAGDDRGAAGEVWDVSGRPWHDTSLL